MTALPSADDMTAWRELARLSRRLADQPGAKSRALSAAVRATKERVIPPEFQEPGVANPFRELKERASRFTTMLVVERIAAKGELLAACAEVEAALEAHEAKRGGRFTQACQRSETRAEVHERRLRADLEGPF